MKARTLCLGLLALAGQADAADPSVAVGREVAVSATLFQGPARAGPLEFMAGARLTSSDPQFRELSGLQATADGRLVAVTDRGLLFEARLVVQEAGLAIEEAYLFELPQGPGDERAFVHSSAAAPAACRADPPRSRAEKYDAEAVVLVDEDVYAVAFERNHRIACYRRLDGMGGPPRLALEICPARFRGVGETLAMAASPDVRQVEGNCGVEGLAYDRSKAALLLLSERPGEAGFAAWAFRGDGAPYPLRYPKTAVTVEGAGEAFKRLTGAQSAPAQPFAREYRPSDMRLLGDDLFVLERYPLARGGPYVSRLMLAKDATHADATLDAKCFASLEGYPPANYEGLAAAVLQNGERWLYLVSDDGDDRDGTVLLLFRIPHGSGGGGSCPD